MLFFATCFIASSFHKLLFTIEKGQGNCFIIYIHCSRGGGAPRFFFLISFILEGEGGNKLMFFFPPSFDIWKEEGKGISFFLKTVFSLLNG